MKINPELKSLIPPLTSEEYNGLEQSIIKEGCRDAIVTWQGIIVDGHNRFEICTKHNIEFNTLEKEFESIEQVKDWMDANQLHRRNLTPDQRKIIIGRRYNREKKTHETQNRGNRFTVQGDQFEHPVKTSERLAEENKISAPTVRRYAKEAEEFERIEKEKPELAKEIWHGQTTLKDVKTEQKKEVLAQKKEEYKKQYHNDIVRKPEIYLSDAIDYINKFEDNSIDLIFTDPPYITDIQNIESFVEAWLIPAIAKVKETGRLYICTGAYPREVKAYLDILLAQDKFIVDNPLIWTYRNTLGVTPKMKYNLNYQLIWHLYSESSPELETSITNEMFTVQDINAPDGRQGNRLHTWQKPDELANRLIRHGSKKNDIVVDCFACTGTFLLAASKQNRLAYGCDNDKDNLKIAQERGCNIHGI